MTDAAVPLDTIVSQLRAEGLIDADDAVAGEYLARRDDLAPWYVRAMVGFGAWLASLLVIGFVVALSLDENSTFVAIGLVLMAGAIAVRPWARNDFVVQVALASCLAGQALFVIGVVSITDARGVEAILMLSVVLNVILFVLFRDPVHRVLTVLFSTGAFAALLYAWELNAIVPVLAPALAAAYVFLSRHPSVLMVNRMGTSYRPLVSGLVLAAFGSVALSTIYVLPDEMRGEFLFYPRPWLSTLLLAPIGYVVGFDVWRALRGTTGKTAAIEVAGCVLVVAVASAFAPGLLLALVVAVSGAATADRTRVALGIGGFAVFLGAWVYGVEASMLVKSVTLAGAGLAVLAGRAVVLRLWPEASHD